MCWLLDGSAVISRCRVSFVQTVPCPRAAPEEGIITAMCSVADIEPRDPALVSLLELSRILAVETADQAQLIRGWLLKRSLPHRPKEPILSAILAGDLHLLVSEIQSTGNGRLAAVASALGGGRGEGEGEELKELALMQLGQLADAPNLDLTVWNVLAGRVDFLLQDGSINWEALLFVILEYTDSTLASAVERLESIISPEQDLGWALLRYHCALKKPFGSYPFIHDLRPDRIGSRYDWSQLWLLCKSMLVERLDQSLLNAHFAGQLLANGYWHLAEGLTRLDLSQFVRTESELELATLAQRSFYRKQVEFVGSKAGQAEVSMALAGRYGYHGNIGRQVDLLLKGGAYAEAQKVSQPLLVEAIMTGDDEMIEAYLERIPVHSRHTMSLILQDYLRIKSERAADDKYGLVQRVSTLVPCSLRERVAFAELAARICQICPSPALLPLLPDDQRRALLYRLSN